MTEVVELRQYTLKPGRRDDLVSVFDDHLVEGQEALGMRIVGQFRDRDRPDRFVWIRSYPDLATQAAALPAFYGGPVWAEHGPAANDTMLDWSDVLLLRPVAGRADAPVGHPSSPSSPCLSLVHVTVCHLSAPAHEVARSFVPPDALAAYETLVADNPFPILPVRDDATVLVLVTRTPPVDLPPSTVRVEHLRLEPTARSAMR